MPVSFDVKILGIETRKGTRRTTHRARWKVDGEMYRESFAEFSLADSFRSSLVNAASRGEAFDTASGLPVSLQRKKVSSTSSHLLFVEYVDSKWPHAAAKSRAGIADALATSVVALLNPASKPPRLALTRRTLVGWVLNTKRRDTPMPAEVALTRKWLEVNMVPAARLEDLTTLRAVLDAIARKMDGTAAAPKTVLRKRAVIYNLLEYAVESGRITRNRLPDVRWTPPKVNRAIDKRVVAINPQQGARLLDSVAALAVPGQPRRSAGPMLRGYFACMYYAALRPEEVARLSKRDLALPSEGWGELMLSGSAPIAGGAWTDTGNRRDQRQLKQRAIGEVRIVPCPPPLTRILNEHITQHGVAKDGRLFRNLTGGDLAESTVSRVWDKARRAALTPEEYISPLARRPYDLRHACVSFWLAVGVPAAQVAEWAGHSITVLLEIYAKVIAGLENSAKQRIEAGLRTMGTAEPTTSTISDEQLRP
jgi:integrase